MDGAPPDLLRDFGAGLPEDVGVLETCEKSEVTADRGPFYLIPPAPQLTQRRQADRVDVLVAAGVLPGHPIPVRRLGHGLLQGAVRFRIYVITTDMSKTAGPGLPDRGKYVFCIIFIQIPQHIPEGVAQGFGGRLGRPDQGGIKKQDSEVGIGIHGRLRGPDGRQHPLPYSPSRPAQFRDGDLGADAEILVAHVVAAGEAVHVAGLEGIDFAQEAGMDRFPQPVRGDGGQSNSRVKDSFSSAGDSSPAPKVRPVRSEETRTSAGLNSIGSTL